VNIQLEWTPNPNTLKYVVDVRLIPTGAVNFTSKEAAAERSPLASRLFSIPGVAGVMVGPTFVTVTKGDEGEWDELNDGVMEALETHLAGNEPVLTGDAAIAAPVATGPLGEVEMRIRQILDDEIRPAVANDGGDITLERYEAGIVYLHMKGSCSGCPSSTMTLKMGIESRLREVIPEVQEVVAV
jgi:Fe-S cluster biogenesis protein NfuA